MIMNKGRITNPKIMTVESYESSDPHEVLRKGPWTLEEDNLLIQYISCHGEGRWNSLAKCSGLRRTGKSCRLRWLNYLKPDIKRGNLTTHEQFMILELHAKWGNRWSKIAQNLPGRTDNEIKNYWRTRVQKQARQLKIDSNSKMFLETIRMFWMPRLMEKMEQNYNSSPTISTSPSSDQLIPPPSDTKPCHVAGNSNSESNIPQQTQDGLRNLTAGKIIQCEGTLDHQDDYYYVGVQSYDMHKLEDQDMCHVAGIDWFGEDLGSSTTFWNTDELWQFWKQGEEQGFLDRP